MILHFVHTEAKIIPSAGVLCPPSALSSMVTIKAVYNPHVVSSKVDKYARRIPSKAAKARSGSVKPNMPASNMVI